MEEMEYMTEDREFTIETPIGSISSDSGNHMVDIVSVMGAIIVLYVVKVFFCVSGSNPNIVPFKSKLA